MAQTKAILWPRLPYCVQNRTEAEELNDWLGRSDLQTLLVQKGHGHRRGYHPLKEHLLRDTIRDETRP